MIYRCIVISYTKFWSEPPDLKWCDLWYIFPFAKQCCCCKKDCISSQLVGMMLLAVDAFFLIIMLLDFIHHLPASYSSSSFKAYNRQHQATFFPFFAKMVPTTIHRCFYLWWISENAALFAASEYFIREEESLIRIPWHK